MNSGIEIRSWSQGDEVAHSDSRSFRPDSRCDRDRFRFGRQLGVCVRGLVFLAVHHEVDFGWRVLSRSLHASSTSSIAVRLGRLRRTFIALSVFQCCFSCCRWPSVCLLLLCFPFCLLSAPVLFCWSLKDHIKHLLSLSSIHLASLDIASGRPHNDHGIRNLRNLEIHLCQARRSGSQTSPGDSLGRILRGCVCNRSVTAAGEEATKKEVSNAYLSQLENNKIVKPSPNVLHALSLVYATSYEDLMRRAGYVSSDAIHRNIARSGYLCG